MRTLFCTLLCFIAAYLPAETIDLALFERRVFSQNGEDGVIEKIFETIGTTNHYYVEFGTENATQCNTRKLREEGWCGLLMDGSYSDPRINLYQEYITAENINSLFANYEVPEDFDLLSIDIDFNDFYVWHAISEIYQPRVVVIEYNATHFPHEDKVIVYDAQGGWDGSNYFGASIRAMQNLGRSKGYSLVYAENQGVNLFFIRDDVLNAFPDVFLHVNDVYKLYKAPRYGQGPRGGHPSDPHKRPYVSSKDILEQEC